MTCANTLTLTLYYSKCNLSTSRFKSETCENNKIDNKM